VHTVAVVGAAACRAAPVQLWSACCEGQRQHLAVNMARVQWLQHSCPCAASGCTLTGLLRPLATHCCCRRRALRCANAQVPVNPKPFLNDLTGKTVIVRLK
jgi:hypothetical protein